MKGDKGERSDETDCASMFFTLGWPILERSGCPSSRAAAQEVKKVITAPT